MRKRFLLIALALSALLGWLSASPALANPGLSVGHMGGKGLNPEVLYLGRAISGRWWPALARRTPPLMS